MCVYEHEHAKKRKNSHDHFTCLNANNQSMILMGCENDGWRIKKTSITQSQAVQGE